MNARETGEDQFSGLFRFYIPDLPVRVICDIFASRFK